MARRKMTPEDRANNVRVGARLRKVIDAYEQSQKAFARSVGLSQSGLSEILSGENQLDPNVARAIRDKWHASLDYLYCGDHGSLPINLANAVLSGKPMPQTKRAR